MPPPALQKNSSYTLRPAFGWQSTGVFSVLSSTGLKRELDSDSDSSDLDDEPVADSSHRPLNGPLPFEPSGYLPSPSINTSTELARQYTWNNSNDAPLSLVRRALLSTLSRNTAPSQERPDLTPGRPIKRPRPEGTVARAAAATGAGMGMGVGPGPVRCPVHNRPSAECAQSSVAERRYPPNVSSSPSPSSSSSAMAAMAATGPVLSRAAVPQASPRQSAPTRITTSPMGFTSMPPLAHIADRAVTSPTRGDPSSIQVAKPSSSTMPTPTPTSVHLVAPPSTTGNRSRSTAGKAQSTSTLVSPASSSTMLPLQYSSYHQAPRSRPRGTQTPTTSATVAPLVSSIMPPPAYVPRSPRVVEQAGRVDSTPVVAPLTSSTMPVSIDPPRRLGASKSSIHHHASKVVPPSPSPSTDVPHWPDVPEYPINGVPSLSAVICPVSPSMIPPPTSISIPTPSQPSVHSLSTAPVSSSSPPKGNILRTSTAASSAQALLMSSNSAPEQPYSNATLDSLLDPMYASSSMTGSVQLVPVDPSMASTEPPMRSSTGVGRYLTPVRHTATLSDGILWTPYEQHGNHTAISVAEIREIVARYIPNLTFSEAVMPSTTSDSTSLPIFQPIARRDSKCDEVLVPASSDAFVTDPPQMDIPVATMRPTKSMPLHYQAGLQTIMASGPRGESSSPDPPCSHRTSSTHVTSSTARVPTPTSKVVPVASSASTRTALALQALESSQRLVQLPSPQNVGVREMSPFFGYDMSVPPAPSPKNDVKFMFFTLDIAQTASSSFSIRATASPPAAAAQQTWISSVAGRGLAKTPSRFAFVTSDHLQRETHWEHIRQARTRLQAGRTPAVWYPTCGPFAMSAPPRCLAADSRVDEIYMHIDLQPRALSAIQSWVLDTDREWAALHIGDVQPSDPLRKFAVTDVSREPCWITAQTYKVYTSRWKWAQRIIASTSTNVG